MARKGRKSRDIASYEHSGKERVNNPPVGLVTPATDKDEARAAYAHDPHLEPSLSWAGKAEGASFEVPTVSLHVHERIDPRTIISAAKKSNGTKAQGSLFETPDQNPPLRQAIEFYRHPRGWSNRLIAGDSLLVMNSLIEKEGLAGQVQMVYMDPPYGVSYRSNFQPFVSRMDVTDKAADLTGEPEQLKAFRDTWELGIHSYLSYLRDRLLLCRELLTDTGSCFVQIGDENIHRVGLVMDDIFGPENRVATISYVTTGSSSAKTLPEVSDYLLWYAKDRKQVKYRQLYETLTRREIIEFFSSYVGVELPEGETRKPTDEERFDPDENLPPRARIYGRVQLTSQGHSTTGLSDPYEYDGRLYHCSANRHWSVSHDGLDRLAQLGRLEALGERGSLRWKQYEEEVAGRRIHNVWPRLMSAKGKRFVVETAPRVIERCLLMTTDPGDLALDPTCGSGTTACVAEQWGRRWITCDTSRVATTLARQRLMTALFDYYDLKRSDEGIASGFNYKSVNRVSPRTLGYDEPPAETPLYDQPETDRSKVRVTGPFTLEAVPAPTVTPIDEIAPPPPRNVSDSLRDTDTSVARTEPTPGDTSVARTDPTVSEGDWRDELLQTGIRGRDGQKIGFSRMEPLPGQRHLHADGETTAGDDGSAGGGVGGAAGGDGGSGQATGPGPGVARRVVVSFGPDHAPLEQRQVARAIEEASKLVPRPTLIVFAAFQFDPEASKDIDETDWPGVTLLKAQMNADLLTGDLKKQRTSNESFWLIGQPDVVVEREVGGEQTGDGERDGGGELPAGGERPGGEGRAGGRARSDRSADEGGQGEPVRYVVRVQGFDYYDTVTGAIVSGGADRIAMWMLDPDYDGRSLFPRQVFFPMAGPKDGWAKLAKTLKAEIDPDRIEAYRGTESLPFEAGEHRRAAVKIVDDRGVESLKIVDLLP